MQTRGKAIPLGHRLAAEDRLGKWPRWATDREGSFFRQGRSGMHNGSRLSSPPRRREPG
jgi:hypothetical protein